MQPNSLFCMPASPSPLTSGASQRILELKGPHSEQYTRGTFPPQSLPLHVLASCTIGSSVCTVLYNLQGDLKKIIFIYLAVLGS